MSAKTNVVVEQDKEFPVEKKVLALAIVDIGTAMRALMASGLNRKAIVVLTAHKSGYSQSTVTAVIDALEQLARDYTVRR